MKDPRINESFQNSGKVLVVSNPTKSWLTEKCFTIPEKLESMFLGATPVSDLPKIDYSSILAAWREAAELYNPSTAELSMNAPFFSDSFESKPDQIKIRMDFEFGFQVARPDHIIITDGPDNRRWINMKDLINRKHVSKMRRRVIRKKLLHVGLKMCHTERQRTNFLLNFIIAQRK